MQGEGTLIPMYRNEHNRSGLRCRRSCPPGGPRHTVNPAWLARPTAGAVPRCSMQGATRKPVSYACVG
jgi:hypothetical protein